MGDLLATLDQPVPERDHAETAVWQGPFLTAFGSLSEDDQEVPRLTTWEGLGPADTAAVLCCSTSAVKVRLHRARQRLRKFLAQAEAASTSPAHSSSVGGFELTRYSTVLRSPG
jgi:DNA-directed RNA polymerase specialized sigma24 family protein